MMQNLLFAVAGILLLLLAWVGVQQLAHRYAARHPELGPAREEGGGCQRGCCSGGRQCPGSPAEYKTGTDL